MHYPYDDFHDLHDWELYTQAFIPRILIYITDKFNTALVL